MEKMKQPVYVYGCGGVGCEIAEQLMNSINYELRGFIDDNPTIRECMGLPSRTLDEVLTEQSNGFKVILSIGEPVIRKRVSEKCAAARIKEVLIDFSSHYNSNYSCVETGTLLHVNSYVSINAHIGSSCLINKNSIIGHDCIIGDYSVISPGVILGGDVTVGECTYIGTSSAIRNGIRIGDNVIVGMGSNVVNDIPNDTVVVGNPARYLRENITGYVFSKD